MILRLASQYLKIGRFNNTQMKLEFKQIQGYFRYTEVNLGSAKCSFLIVVVTFEAPDLIITGKRNVEYLRGRCLLQL